MRVRVIDEVHQSLHIAPLVLRKEPGVRGHPCFSPCLEGRVNIGAPVSSLIALVMNREAVCLHALKERLGVVPKNEPHIWVDINAYEVSIEQLNDTLYPDALAPIYKSRLIEHP